MTNGSFQFANQSALLLGYFIDNYETTKFSERIIELSDIFLQGRISTLYKPELSLIGRLFYYTPSLLFLECTPGQSFCDFVLVKTKTSDKISGTVSTRVTKSQLLLLAILYSTFPYFIDRRDSIYSKCSDIWSILMKEDSDERNNMDIANSMHTTNNENAKNASIFTKIYNAIKLSIYSMHSNNSGRLSSIASFADDIHKFLFLLTGK